MIRHGRRSDTLKRGGSFLFVALFCAGCLHEERRRALLEDQYSQPVTLDTTKAAALDQLKDLVVTDGPCLSIGAPCRSEGRRAQTPGSDICLERRREQACFSLVETSPTSISVRSFDRRGRLGELGLWLIERLDSRFAERREAAEAQAELEAVADEKVEVRQASTVWGHGRLVFVAAGGLNAGVQFQAGYRRWITSSLLLAVGGGYETVVVSSASALLKPAVLMTTRLEFSSAQRLKSSVLNLPWLAPFFGVTGVFVTAPGGGVGLRGFIGLSSLIPVSIELGVSALILPNRSPTPAFFVAAGFGL